MEKYKRERERERKHIIERISVIFFTFWETVSGKEREIIIPNGRERERKKEN